MKKYIFSIFLCTIFTIFSANEIFACRCLPEKSVEDEYERSTIVFSGQVISVKNTNRYLKVKIRVAKTWKGKSSKIITFLTGANGAMCGIKFVKEEKYLIYSDSKNMKELTVSLCSRTEVLSEAKEDIKILDNLKSKSAPK